MQCTIYPGTIRVKCLTSIWCRFLGCIVLSIRFDGAVAASHAADSIDVSGPAATAPAPRAPELGPAEPRVVVESAWLVPSEEPAGTRMVTGPRPADAAESLVTARFRYEGDAPAAGLRIVVAIPADLALVAGSATGPGAVVSYSIDGGASFDAADALTMPDSTHIRWDLPGEHPPGIAGLVSFRARPIEAGAGAEPQ